jgi:hypothetical protein
MFREAGTQVPLVTMSCPSPRTIAPPPCLPLGIKDSLKEDIGEMLMLLMAGVCLPASCTKDSMVKVKGFLAGKLFGFWLFGCGRLLEGRSAGGKRVAEG